jgi:hypothetical protein
VGHDDLGSKRGVVRGYHLCADAAGVPVSGGVDGLVQPICARVGTVEFTRGGVFSWWRWRVRWRALGRRFSRAIRGGNLRARTLQEDSSARGSGSAWTGGAGWRTTSLSSGCAEA